MRADAAGGLGLAVLSAATFGTSGSFAGALLAVGWTPGAAVTARVTLAALMLTIPAVLALRGRGRDLLRHSRTVVLYGVVAVAGAQLCYFNAVQHLSVAVALLLEYSGVLLVVGWQWLLHHQRPRRLTGLGAAVSLVGLALVLNLLGDQRLDLVGVVWALGAAVGLAVYFVVSAGSSGEDTLPPLVAAWGGLAVGSTLLLTAGAIGVLPMAAPLRDVTLMHRQVGWFVPVVGLSLVAAVIAYVAGIAAARMLGARLSSFVGLLEVVFAVLFAWVLLGQGPHLVQLAGGVLVLAGIVLVRIDELRGPAPVVPVLAGLEPVPVS